MYYLVESGGQDIGDFLCQDSSGDREGKEAPSTLYSILFTSLYSKMSERDRNTLGHFLSRTGTKEPWLKAQSF